VIFFSGFSLKGEEELFKEYLNRSEFCVAGFSYGAIKAFEYVCNSSKRVDTLQLFSPAFFQNNSEKFIRLQLLHYQKDASKYEENFINNCAYPSSIDLKKYFKKSDISSLEELLRYSWDAKRVKKLVDRGVKIEVYLGENDKIINSLEAKEFFKEFSVTYYIKKVGHLLHG
jgi:hypothetical protein